MLAALLPLIETLGAEGGAASALGGGGLDAMLGRMGFSKAFGSQAEMGQALRKISDLTTAAQQAQSSMQANRQRQEQIAQQARHDEQHYMLSDPRHQQQISALEQTNQQLAAERANHQRELSALNTRLWATNNPDQASHARLASLLTATAAMSAMAPKSADGRFGMREALNPFAAMRWVGGKASAAGQNFGHAAQNVGSEFAGQTNSAILGQGGSYALDTLKQVFHPSGMVLQLSKLPSLIRGWSEALVDSKRDLGQFNGTIAMANAEAQRRTIIRNIESGARTGGAVSELSGTLQNLYDKVQPISDTVTLVIAKSLTQGVQFLSRGVEVLENLWKIVAAWDPTGLAKDIDRIAKAQEQLNKLNMGMPIDRLMDEARRGARGRMPGVAKR